MESEHKARLPNHAQTNFALLIQAAELGFSADSLLKLQQSYEYVAMHFSGHYRPGFKPFINHLCGVASCSLRHRMDLDLGIAALLHSVYVTGQKPDRASVRKVAGVAAEQLAFEYHQAKKTVIGSETLPDAPQDVLFLQLCNEFDDLWDAAHMFAPSKSVLPGLAFQADGMQRIAALCEQAGAAGLADDYSLLFQRLADLPPLPAIDAHAKSYYRGAAPPPVSPGSKQRERLGRRILRAITGSIPEP